LPANIITVSLQQRPAASDSLRSLLSVLPYQASLGQKGNAASQWSAFIIPYHSFKKSTISVLFFSSKEIIML